jgi:DNA-binding MarR family transcriptional regulator
MFDPYQYFGFLTNRVSRLLNHLAEAMLRDHGYHFPVSCLGIMADLWSQDGVTQKELGISLIKTKSSITKMLDALAKENLIYKTDHPEDKRNKLIYLTAKGRELQDIVTQQGMLAEKILLSDKTEKNLQTAKSVLKTLYHNLSQEIFEHNQSLKNE